MDLLRQKNFGEISDEFKILSKNESVKHVNDKLNESVCISYVKINHFDTNSDENFKSGAEVENIKEKCVFSKHEILIIALLCYGNFCIACAYSILAPFFPEEAVRKGSSQTENGFIFAVYQIVIFIIAPVYGKLIPHVTPKFLITNGLLVCGSCSVLFGILQWSPDGGTFIGLCFAVRIIEALGSGAFFTACWTIIALDFPDHIGRLFATTEMCFGVGMIIGPAIGGGLYTIGKKYSIGFCLPFLVMGIMLLIGTIVIYFLLKESKNVRKVERTSVFGMLKHFSITLNVLICINCFILIGFNEATLQQHMKFLNLNEGAIGGIFMIVGGMYALFNQLWGYASERVSNAHPLCLIGCSLTLISFLIVGPAPFFPFEPALWLIILSQVLLGIGWGGQFVASFVQGLRETINCGFPDNVSTYAVIAGIYSSAFALGAGIGPAIGGAMVDWWGFRVATMPCAALQITMMIAIIIFNAFQMIKNRKESNKCLAASEDAIEISDGQSIE